MAPAQAVIRANIGKLVDMDVAVPKKSLAMDVRSKHVKASVRSLSDDDAGVITTAKKTQKRRGRKKRDQNIQQAPIKKVAVIAKNVPTDKNDSDDEDNDVLPQSKMIINAKDLRPKNLIVIDVEGERPGPTVLKVHNKKGETGYVSAGWINRIKDDIIYANFLSASKLSDRSLSSKNLSIGEKEVRVDGDRHIDSLLFNKYLPRQSTLPQNIIDKVTVDYFDIE